MPTCVPLGWFRSPGRVLGGPRSLGPARRPLGGPRSLGPARRPLGGSRSLALLAALTLCTASAPLGAQPADSLPAGFRDAFTAADTRARAVAYWLQCVPTVARLRAAGRFGEATDAPRHFFCARTADGEPIGGMFDADSAFTTMSRLQLVRLDGERPDWSGPVDSASVLASVGLAQVVTAQLDGPWRRQNRPFSAVPIVLGDREVEVWAIPRANRGRMMVIGGDMGFAPTASGAPRVLADRSASWTQVPLPPDGPIVIESASPVPPVADLVTARYHAELGRVVVVRSGSVESRLVPGLDPATGARVVWEHSVGRP